MPPQLRIAVDAANLARDRRGMGRLARATLRAAANDASLAVTFLAERGPDVRALRTEFANVPVCWPISAQQRRAYDVVWYPFNGMRFTCAAPAVVTLHDAFAFTEPHPQRVARFREQAPIRRAARRAARIVTDSHWSRDEIVRVLDVAPERIAVVTPEPDPFWFPLPGDELPPGVAGHSYVLLVGATEPRKNARVALEACARALDAHERLVVVGTLSPQDRAFARSRAVPCGEISASDPLLRALYRQARAVLVPSLAEGFGLVAVEALACGAPVVAANRAALPEATAGAALLLDPSDVTAWAQAIRALFDDEAYAATLRARAHERFATADRTRGARAMLAELRRTAGASR